MKIGVLSDTHGDVKRARQAALLLAAIPCGCVFHCGDIGPENVLLELSEILGGAGIPVYLVLGNMDHGQELMGFPKDGGLRVCGRMAEMTLDGKSIAVLHGDDAFMLSQSLISQKFDYLLTGHTHQAENTLYGKTRRINPGALHRTSYPTVAVLDTQDDRVTFLPVKD